MSVGMTGTCTEPTVFCIALLLCCIHRLFIDPAADERGFSYPVNISLSVPLPCCLLPHLPRGSESVERPPPAVCIQQTSCKFVRILGSKVSFPWGRRGVVMRLKQNNGTTCTSRAFHACLHLFPTSLTLPPLNPKMGTSIPCAMA
jgi:hypothetical protein